MSVWIIEVSIDGGKTWEIGQNYGMYRGKDRCESRVEKENFTGAHLNPRLWPQGRLHRAVEYVSVQRYHRAVFDLLGMDKEQRAYSWHDVEDALTAADKEVTL